MTELTGYQAIIREGRSLQDKEQSFADIAIQETEVPFHNIV